MKSIVGKSLDDLGELKKRRFTTKKVKRDYCIFTDQHTPSNKEISDIKTTEIEGLTLIVYDHIVQSYLGTRYSVYEFQAGVKWFVSEGIKTLPQEKLNKFYEYTPEDFVRYLPAEIIDAIYPTKPDNINIQESSPSIDTGYDVQTVLTNLSNKKNLEHKIEIFKILPKPKEDTIRKARIRYPDNSKNHPIDLKKAVIRHTK